MRDFPALNVTVGGIPGGSAIPERFARCVPDGKGESRSGDNIRPAIRWTGAPQGVRSYAIIVVDKDVPARFDTANQRGKTIPADMPRKHFYHWVQVDIPPTVTEFPEGPAGKAQPGLGGQSSYGSRGSDEGMGYDGPCPPWNDERLHHYHFIVYALDVPTLGLRGHFSGEQAKEAMQGHILAKGEVVGSYATNQRVRQAA
jgi:Raf kinase inhibitor-like YbhB/YbcL family protein